MKKEYKAYSAKGLGELGAIFRNLEAFEKGETKPIKSLKGLMITYNPRVKLK